MSSRKNEILALARTLFADRGYSATSMRDLAEASGVLPGSLYAHFRSKADLAHQIVMEFFTELLPQQQEVYDAKGSGAERLVRMIDVVFAICDTHHEAVRLLHYDWKTLSQMEELEDMRQATDRTLELWRDTVFEGVQDGSIDPDIDPEYMVRIIASALNGILDKSRFLMRPSPSSPLGGGEHLKRCLVVGITTASGADDVRQAVSAAPTTAAAAGRAKRPRPGVAKRSAAGRARS